MAANPIVHLDIPVNDEETSTGFYQEVFGWEIDNSWPGYAMFKAEGGPGGGFVKIGGDGIKLQAGEVLVYIDSKDIDASIASVESHGGTIVAHKSEIPTVGWYATFKDPAGNLLGIFQSV